MNNEASNITVHGAPDQDTTIIYAGDNCQGEAWALTPPVDDFHFLTVDYEPLVDMGWNDRGQSVMIPEGYMLTLYQDTWDTGVVRDFYGTGSCQSLENMSNSMSAL